MASLHERASNKLVGVFKYLDDAAVDRAVEMIAGAKRLVVFVGGREKLRIMDFAMRLYHMGLNAAVKGNIITSPTGPGNLFVVTIGPGDISTGLALMNVVKKAGTDVPFMTAQPKIRDVALADFVLHLPAQTMADDQGEARTSVLPTESLYEGALLKLHAVMILKLTKHLSVTAKDMRVNHTKPE